MCKALLKSTIIAIQEIFLMLSNLIRYPVNSSKLLNITVVNNNLWATTLQIFQIRKCFALQFSFFFKFLYNPGYGDVQWLFTINVALSKWCKIYLHDYLGLAYIQIYIKWKLVPRGCLVFQRRGQTIPGNDYRVYLLLVIAALAALRAKRQCRSRS